MRAAVEDNAINLLEPPGCNVGFKVYESVAKFEQVKENRGSCSFARRRYSSVARPPTENLEGRDVLKE